MRVAGSLCIAVMILIGSAAAQSPQTVTGKEWWFIGYQSSLAGYVDTRSATRDANGLVRIWIEQVPKNSGTLPRPVRTLTEIDCVEEVYQVTEMQILTKENQIDHWRPKSPRISVRDSSPSGVVFGLLCKNPPEGFPAIKLDENETPEMHIKTIGDLLTVQPK